MEKKSFLTIREKEIFELLVQNFDTEEIADKLKISRSYVSRIEKRALTKIYLYLKDHY